MLVAITEKKRKPQFLKLNIVPTTGRFCVDSNVFSLQPYGARQNTKMTPLLARKIRIKKVSSQYFGIQKVTCNIFSASHFSAASKFRVTTKEVLFYKLNLYLGSGSIEASSAGTSGAF